MSVGFLQPGLSVKRQDSNLLVVPKLYREELCESVGKKYGMCNKGRGER